MPKNLIKQDETIKPPIVWEASCTCGWYCSGPKKGVRENAKAHVNSHIVRVRKAIVRPYNYQVIKKWEE